MRHHARLLLSRVALLMAVGTFPASAQQPHMGEWADRGLWIIHERMVAEIAAIAIELEAPAAATPRPGVRQLHQSQPGLHSGE